jgi:hypothetical protein
MNQETNMTYQLFVASAFMLATGSFSAVDRASAFPTGTWGQYAAEPGSGIVEVLCKYGTPHCINKDPRPKLPDVGGVAFPDSGWEDPDCKYYGNCNPGPDNWGDPAARKGLTGSAPKLTHQHSPVQL